MSDKSFTKLLKCYLLNVISALPEDTLQVLRNLEPRLQQTYDCPRTWDQIVASQMDFPPDFPDQVRHLWQRNTQLANDANQTLLPTEFVDMLIRENFPYALD
ncbi:MAG: hypothetical protein IPH76_03445 [Xanthomonadales bacterium]|nr:hypothetical protein [Xanthomonadales bacterium]